MMTDYAGVYMYVKINFLRPTFFANFIQVHWLKCSFIVTLTFDLEFRSHILFLMVDFVGVD